jgi:hypothetical protein
LIERRMSSLWCSRIQKTQDVAGPTGWCYGNSLSRETLPPIEAAEEKEDSANRRNDIKGWGKDLKNRKKS